MTRAVLGLGANLGDAREALRRAVSGLVRAGQLEVLAVSGLWRTRAVGGPAQPEYLNAVVLARTGMSPPLLLGAAQALEAAAGRVREVRWGPRTLDVDVLDVEGFRSDEPSLTVPHPRAHERAFVLAPWAQVDPEWLLRPAGLPVRTVAQWRAALADDPAQAVSLEDGGPWWR
jgi:2-amino-4-hydroxy-6-hydroxymethyldihydropteridine diphosphokinase